MNPKSSRRTSLAACSPPSRTPVAPQAAATRSLTASAPAARVFLRPGRRNGSQPNKETAPQSPSKILLNLTDTTQKSCGRHADAAPDSCRPTRENCQLGGCKCSAMVSCCAREIAKSTLLLRSWSVPKSFNISKTTDSGIPSFSR